MKKRLFITITSIVLVLCSLLSACTLIDFGKEPGVGDEITEELKPDIEIKDTTFNFEIKQIDSWYYPTFTGVITLEYYPNKMTVLCQDIETVLNPVSIKYVDGKYEFMFDQQIMYSELKQGNYKVIVYGYSNNKKNVLNDRTKLKVDSDYFAMSILNNVTGESIYAMDKNKNWTEFH